jgi:hypothetical protein
MFDVRSWPVLYVFAMEPHRSVTILATELGNAVTDRIGHSHRDPFAPLFVTALEHLLDLAVVDSLVGF